MPGEPSGSIRGEEGESNSNSLSIDEDLLARQESSLFSSTCSLSEELFRHSSQGTLSSIFTDSRPPARLTDYDSTLSSSTLEDGSWREVLKVPVKEQVRNLPPRMDKFSGRRNTTSLGGEGANDNTNARRGRTLKTWYQGMPGLSSTFDPFPPLPRPADGHHLTLVNLREVQGWVENVEVDMHLVWSQHPRRRTTKFGCVPWTTSGSDVPGLRERLWADKDRLFFLQLMHFDAKDSMHFRMLQTIHFRLTHNEVCPKEGHHWRDVGFQAWNPEDDLNGSGGVLCVIQLFYFLMTHPHVLQAIYQLSLDDQRGFPLAIFSIRITQMVSEALSVGSLSALCNKSSHGIVNTMCDVHNAALYHFYSLWRSTNRTTLQAEEAFLDVSAHLLKKPTKLIGTFQRAVKNNEVSKNKSLLEFADPQCCDAWAVRPDCAKRRGRAMRFCCALSSTRLINLAHKQ